MEKLNYTWMQLSRQAEIIKQSAADYQKPIEPFDTYKTYYDYTRNRYIARLDGCYDIKEIKVVFEQDRTYDYTIEVAYDDRVWVVPRIEELAVQASCISGKLAETGRRYVMVTLNGDTPLELIKEIELYAVKTPDFPIQRTAEAIQGVPTPIIMPLPECVPGTQNAVIDLSGTWRFMAVPSSEYWWDDSDFEQWHEVTIPGCPEVEGHEIDKARHQHRNLEFVYKKLILIPQDAEGKRIFVRFSSIVTMGRIWVNGNPVGVHSGSYCAFDCEITDYCTPGQTAMLTVGVTQVAFAPEFEIANCGISGPVKLIIAQEQHLTRFAVETDLDEYFCNATLIIRSAASMGKAEKSEAVITLYDPEGKEVVLDGNTVIYNDQSTVTTSFAVAAPALWDAEHPNLYTVKAELNVNGQTVEYYSRKIGFRKVTIEGNQFKINGSPVHLRGVCWANINPVGGMTYQQASDWESLILLKQANVNMIRTAHYPQYDEILELCDKIGIYVELEATTMINTHWAPEFLERHRTLEDPAYADWFVGVFASTVERARSNPCVIYYSTGNESDWGDNIEAQIAYIRQADPSRPIKYSWGYYAPEDMADIYSFHYPDATEFSAKRTRPTIYDEYAHLYHQQAHNIQQDPGLRDLYGYAIQKEWNASYYQDGCMGACIWNARDFIYYTPHGPAGMFNAEWGLLDSWNRVKPEYYHVKKAYSPVRLDDLQVISNPGEGKPVMLLVENRYDHTNLDEITCNWVCGRDSGEFKLPAITPGKTGSIYLPGRLWKDGEELTLKFIRDRFETVEQYEVDKYCFVIGGVKAPVFPGVSPIAPVVSQTDTQIIICGQDFELIFDKQSGKISSGSIKGKTLIIGGPDLNLGVHQPILNWRLRRIDCKIEGSEAVVTVRGGYTNIPSVTFEIRIDGAGRIDIGYRFVMPEARPNDVGVVLQLVEEFDRVSWSAHPDLWSCYPQDHIGRLSGTAFKHNPYGEHIYRIKPKHAWTYDNMAFRIGVNADYKATNDFRAAKHNLYTAQINTPDGLGIQTEMDGYGSVRANVGNDEILFYINNEWADTGLGEFQKHNVKVKSNPGLMVDHHLILRFMKNC